MRKSKFWTPEREAVMREHYETAMPMDEIVRLVNKLPGEPITRVKLGIGAYRLKLKRPPELLAEHLKTIVMVGAHAPRVWTPRRNKMIRELYLAGKRLAYIRDRVNETDGKKTTCDGVRRQLVKLGVPKRKKYTRPPVPPAPRAPRIALPVRMTTPAPPPQPQIIGPRPRFPVQSFSMLGGRIR